MISTKTMTIGAIALVVLFLTVPFIWFSGLGVFAAYSTFFQVVLPRFLIIILGLGVIAAGIYFEKVSILVVGALVVLGGLGYVIGVHTFKVKSVYASEITTVEEVTSYADRAPWTVANSYAQRDQGDIIGDRESIHYVPGTVDSQAEDGKGSSRYTTLVEGRAFLGMAGYSAVQTLDMPTTGSIPGDSSDYCEVPATMTDKLSSFWPGHSLSWNIHSKAPFAHWDTDDAYAYCQDDEPVIVVPLYKWEGFFWVTKAPNGAALYTSDGVTILSPKELSEESIEGPTYPRSIAHAQRSSINAGGSFADYWGRRVGYETTAKDMEDTNVGNTTEFTMISGDGTMSYVTPLTPRGSSQSLTAISSIEAQQSPEGRSPIVINTSTDLPATSTMMTNIKESSVQGDNAWTTRWASGMTVYELIPAQDGHWVASIGQGQAVSYRADIAPDGSVTVTNSDTGQSSAGTEDGDSVTVQGDRPLADMTDEELLQLIQDATTELQERQSSE